MKMNFDTFPICMSIFAPGSLALFHPLVLCGKAAHFFRSVTSILFSSLAGVYFSRAESFIGAHYSAALNI